MNLPIGVHGDAFEFAVTKEEAGTQKVICVGSKICTTETFVKEIVYELADTAVAISTDLITDDSVDEENIDSDESSIEKVLGLLESSLVGIKSHNLLDTSDGGDEEPYHEDSNLAEVEQVVQLVSQPESSQNSQVQIDCSRCGASGFRNMWFLRRHMGLMHGEAVKCQICENVFIDKFIDKFNYLQHSKTCYYWCSRAGCPVNQPCRDIAIIGVVHLLLKLSSPKLKQVPSVISRR